MYGQYNVLNEINASRKEALHSSLIASFLKEHEILCAFIKLLSGKININSDELIDGAVDTEFVCSESKKIDILVRLKFKPGGSKEPSYRVLIIENKIYARDQPQQLDNYFAALKELGYTSQEIVLIYLTREGDDPSEDSICADNKENASLIKLSYKKDIMRLLKDSLALETVQQNFRLKSTIQSYKELLVEHLFADGVTRSPELVWQFVSLLQQRYAVPDEDADNNYSTCTKEEFLDFFPKSPQGFGFNIPLIKCSLNSNKDATIYFCIEIEYFIYYGLSLEVDGSFYHCDYKNNHQQLKDLGRLITQLFKEGFENHYAWLGWKYFNLKQSKDKYWPNLRVLDEESRATLQDDAKRQALIDSMIDDINSHMCDLEPRLLELNS
ncbi:PD-(D/E)XK nuclease family protein [Anaerobiospirillum succiniciproducens]|uniref:PD-(D/E)XK nuclease family protein n=1 Tax=Anaerobiospirillum succiniciproducens TaxID=13335 RepID=UPI00248DF687|nr:PD-(D/E)XK nuclease family protein [Anaerobiospirillum succiniciproducens]